MWRINARAVDAPSERVGTFYFRSRERAAAALWEYLCDGLAVTMCLEDRQCVSTSTVKS